MGFSREQPTKKTRKHQNITASRRKSEGTSKPRRSPAAWSSDKYEQHQQQPTTNNQQPTTNNQQPTTNNQQPTTNNQQPTTTTTTTTTNNTQHTTNNKQQTTTSCKLLQIVGSCSEVIFLVEILGSGCSRFPSFQSGTFPAVQIHHSARKFGSIYIWAASQKSEELTTEFSGCLLTPTSYKSPVKPINFQPFILGESPHLVSG